MTKLIVNAAVTANGAFEAPVPAPDGWLVLDPDSQQASLEMWQVADAMVRSSRAWCASATGPSRREPRRRRGRSRRRPGELEA